MFENQKTSANAMKKEQHLSEVTVTIQSSDLENYHQTFTLDHTKYQSFNYLGQNYNIPPSKVAHYPHSFWDFPRKLGSFYERHKTWGTLLDWFHFAKKNQAEIGYLYEKGKVDPLVLKPRLSTHDRLTGAVHDWALINYHLQNNRSIEGAMHDADTKLRGKQDMPVGIMLLIGILAVVVIGIVVAVSMFSGNHQGAVTTVQNVTATPFPFQTPFHLGGQ